jgi:hypothetical protein
MSDRMELTTTTTTTVIIDCDNEDDDNNNITVKAPYLNYCTNMRITKVILA